MATDITQIQLSDAERRLLAEAADRTGKPWPQVLSEALRQYRAPRGMANGIAIETWYDRLSRHGFVGCLEGGPTDLSTNPVHREGFGKCDH